MRRMAAQPFKYYVFLDFEATCQKDEEDLRLQGIPFQKEIIEFPLVLLRVAKKQIAVVDSYQLYVKPVVNPDISAFCTELTGIKQEQVNGGVELAQALKLAHEWLQKHGLVSHDMSQYYHTSSASQNDFVFVTDGPWDFTKFLEVECRMKGIALPSYYTRWVNIRSLFSEFYKCRRCGIKGMLNRLGMTFEGREHSGLDDSLNIARIAEKMIRDGCILDINERISQNI